MARISTDFSKLSIQINCKLFDVALILTRLGALFFQMSHFSLSKRYFYAHTWYAFSQGGTLKIAAIIIGIFISIFLFSDFSNYVNGLPVTVQSIDAFVMMSYRNNMAGILGMAWVGTTCFSDKQFRTSISEYYQTQQLTAIVKYYSFYFFPSLSESLDSIFRL